MRLPGNKIGMIILNVRRNAVYLPELRAAVKPDTGVIMIQEAPEPGAMVAVEIDEYGKEMKLEERVYALEGYKMRKYERLITYVTEDLHMSWVENLTMNSGVQSLGVRIWIRKKKRITLVNVYRDPAYEQLTDGNTALDTLMCNCELERMSGKDGGLVVMSGDLNIKTPLFGKYGGESVAHPPSSAQILRKHIMGVAGAPDNETGAKKVVVLNDGSPTRFPAGNQHGLPSAIDGTVVWQRPGLQASGWKAGRGPFPKGDGGESRVHFSDHACITLDIAETGLCDMVNRPPPFPYRCKKRRKAQPNSEQQERLEAHYDETADCFKLKVEEVISVCARRPNANALGKVVHDMMMDIGKKTREVVYGGRKTNGNAQAKVRAKKSAKLKKLAKAMEKAGEVLRAAQAA